MAYIVSDRVKETTTTAGSGAKTLAGAVSGFRAFGDVCVNNDQVPYAIIHQTLAEWEIGVGTWGTGGTLTSALITASSNAGAAVVFSAGTKDVFLASTADAAARTTVNLSITPSGTSQATARLLTAEINNIPSVSPEMAVRCPPALPGGKITIANHASSVLTVYPASGETIEGGAVNAPMTLTSGHVYRAACSAAGAWVGLDANAYDDENKSFIVPINTAALPSFGDNLSMARIVARTLAGKALLGVIGNTGGESLLQPLLATTKVARTNPLGNSTTAEIADGQAWTTIVGTSTARNVATTNALTRMKRRGLVSAATAGSLTHQRGGSGTTGVAQYTTGTSGSYPLGGFMFVHRFGISDAATVSGARMFIGLAASTAAPTNVEPNTLVNCVGIAQLSTDATQLYLVYGGTSAQTAIALGATDFSISTTTPIELALFAPAAAVRLIYYQVTNLANGNKVTGTLSGTAAQIPDSTVLLCPHMWRCNNATALAVGVDLCSNYIATDQ